MKVMREAVKAVQRYVAGPAWKDYIIFPHLLKATDASDAQLDSHIRANTGAILHGVGTAAMSAKNAKGGVVNPDLYVKGISGLRIVDASVLIRNLHDVEYDADFSSRLVAPCAVCSYTSCCICCCGAGCGPNKVHMEVLIVLKGKQLPVFCLESIHGYLYPVFTLVIAWLSAGRQRLGRKG